LGKNLPTKLSCSIFKDHYSGKQMRAIGGIFYAPSYIPKGEGAWHIKIFAGATSSDILTLLETVITVMGRGETTAKTWAKRRFTDTGEPYWSRSVCRPLDDYTGDELFTMVALPVDIEASMILEVSQTETVTAGTETGGGWSLRTLRQDAGLTLEEVAARAGYPSAYLAKVENGSITPPDSIIVKYTNAVVDGMRARKETA
jgi:hypothetical protein